MKTGAAAIISWLLLVACNPRAAPPSSDSAGAPVPDPAVRPVEIAQTANPASTRCIEVMGRVVIEKRADGSEFGVCYFEDNYQCEEWALYRGECPIGGRRITGYATPAGRYCAITGGEYTGVVASDNSERGDCVLPGGKKCDADAYYRGICAR